MLRIVRSVLSRPSLVQQVLRQTSVKATQFEFMAVRGICKSSLLMDTSKSKAVKEGENVDILKELSGFVEKEIKLEKEQSVEKPQITGFDAKCEGPNVTLEKKHQNEQITVKFNVNGSLDDSSESAMDETEATKEGESSGSQIKSRPAFSVDLKRGNQVLTFLCSFLPSEEGEEVEDFQIDEFGVHGGAEIDDKVYMADCSVLDGQLYDLLLNLLDERGVGEEFASQLSQFSSSYEHEQYIDLLEKLKKFTTTK